MKIEKWRMTTEMIPWYTDTSEKFRFGSWTCALSPIWAEAKHSQKDKESQSVLNIKQIWKFLFFRTIHKNWCNISLYGLNKFVCQRNEFYFSCLQINCSQIFTYFHYFFFFSILSLLFIGIGLFLRCRHIQALTLRRAWHTCGNDSFTFNRFRSIYDHAYSLWYAILMYDTFNALADFMLVSTEPQPRNWDHRYTIRRI